MKKKLISGIEIWKVYPHNNEYAVSNMGNVKGIVPKQGRVLGKLTAWTKSAGYRVCRTVNKYVHQMVLEMFVGDCPKGLECRHKNGDKLDNRLSNLCWGTSSENKKDNWKHGKFANRISKGPLGYKHTEEAKARMSKIALARQARIRKAKLYGKAS